MQSSIALSTFHSEYVGLSHSMRILLPLRALLHEVIDMLGLPPAIASTIHCCVHQDNASALLLANSQHLNNRNKYLAVKLHHFWSHVKPGIIEVVKCDTKLMLADTLIDSSVASWIASFSVCWSLVVSLVLILFHSAVNIIISRPIQRKTDDDGRWEWDGRSAGRKRRSERSCRPQNSEPATTRSTFERKSTMTHLPTVNSQTTWLRTTI